MQRMQWVLLVLCCSVVGANQVAAQPAKLVYLEQGWSTDERQKYYYDPQGSELIPYSWFLALEQPFSDKPFRDAEYIASFRYLPNDVNQFNPDGLPVGFTKSRRAGKDWMGLTCAACHTGQFSYRGTNVRIDGGSGLPDITEFQQAVTDALRATINDPKKFDRFASKVVTTGVKDEMLGQLRQDVRKRVDELADWGARSRPAYAGGFGRWDAMHVAFNDVAAVAIRAPQNFRTPIAPASYPCIWLTNQLDNVLWNGSVHNILSRGMGEAVIVFGRLSVSDDLKFTSSVSIEELDNMYGALAGLEPPKWPEDILGKIDATKAERGAKLYEREGCVQCHLNKPPYPQTKPNQYGQTFIRTTNTPLAQIGTDPVYAQGFLTRQAEPGIAAPLLKGTMFEGKPSLPVAILFLDALKVFTDVKLTEMKASPEQRLELMGNREAVSVPTTLPAVEATMKVLTGYKTQPLAGVWSTAPYLHNGSVPNLHELLTPPEKRVKVFFVGDREFDPVRVGYESGEFPGAFRFDASLPGNSNAGHDYGTRLTDAERSDLIEYLKTL